MNEKRIVVPEGMLKAAERAGREQDGFRANNLEASLAGALLWLSENPIVPTREQSSALWDEAGLTSLIARTEYVVIQWQRRMFLAPPEPEVPEEVKDLLHHNYVFAEDYNQRIIEAFRRGQKSK